MPRQDRVVFLRPARRALAVLLAGAAALAAGCRAKSEVPVARDLVDENPRVAFEAKQKYISMGERAAPILAKTAREALDPALAQQALLTLGYVGREPAATDPAARALAAYLLHHARNSPEGRVAAIAAIRLVGASGIPTLADVLARTEVTLGDPKQPPATIDLVTVMVTISKHETVKQLVAMLGAEKYKDCSVAITSHLRLITNENFQYNPKALESDRRAAIKQWKDWWEGRGQYEGAE